MNVINGIVGKVGWLLVPPTFEEEYKTRTAALLNVILQVLIAGTILYAVTLLVVLFPYQTAVAYMFLSTAFILELSSFSLMRLGHVRLASALLLGGLWGIVSVGTIASSDMGSPVIIFHVVIVIIASLLLGKRAVIYFSFVSILFGVWMFYAEMVGLFPPPFVSHSRVSTWGLQILNLVVSAALMYVVARNLSNAFERARLNERAQVEINRELQVEITERIKTEKALERRNEELSILNEISRAINSTLDLQDMLDVITERTIRLLNADAASVALRDGDGGELTFTAASGGASDFVRGRQLEMGQGIAGWVTQQGEPALVPDVSEDPRFFDHFDAESGFSTRSILCVPLRSKGETIGAIEVMHERTVFFDHDDMRLLSTLASSAAIAIENAQLYEQAQQEIEERRQIEDALREERASLARRVALRTADLSAANAELARAARLKDEFVSNVSHELRTPLSVLMLLVDNLENLYDRLEDARRRKMIQDIQKHMLVLGQLIDGILETSRIDGGTISMEREQVNLAQLVREEVEGQRPLAKKKSQLLRLVGVEQMDIWGSDSQLRRVVSNLVNNALKYTPEGGQIICECAVLSSAAPGWPGSDDLPGGSWAAMRVMDNGSGIDEEHLPRMFERFYRVEKQGNIPGTGLGLSIARELVELHAGHIAVSSIVGEGSIFAVYLPLLEEG